MTTMDYVAMAVIVAAGSIVQGVLGFGSSIVWMGFFPFFTSSVQVAVGVLQPIAHTLNAVVLSRVWKSAMNPLSSSLLPLAVAFPFGIILGIWIVTTWSPPSINVLLGIFIMLYVYDNRDEFNSRMNNRDEVGCDKPVALELVSLEPPNNENDFDRDDIVSWSKDMVESRSTSVPSIHPPQTNCNILKSIVAGFFGGCLTSAFGTGGPPILIYARESGWDRAGPDCFRANLQLIFFYCNTLTNASLFYEGVITYETLKTSAMLIPAMILGGVSGSAIASKIDKDSFKKMVLVALALMGMLYIVRSFGDYINSTKA